jgi:hypothetical protein
MSMDVTPYPNATIGKCMYVGERFRPVLEPIMSGGNHYEALQGDEVMRDMQRAFEYATATSAGSVIRRIFQMMQAEEEDSLRGDHDLALLLQILKRSVYDVSVEAERPVLASVLKRTLKVAPNPERAMQPHNHLVVSVNAMLGVVLYESVYDILKLQAEFGTGVRRDISDVLTGLIMQGLTIGGVRICAAEDYTHDAIPGYVKRKPCYIQLQQVY